MTTIRRRQIVLGAASSLLLSMIPKAEARETAKKPGFEPGGMINAAEHGLVADLATDQSDILNGLIARSAEMQTPLFLPAGNYRVSGLALPSGTRIAGIAGATRLTYSGAGTLITANDVQSIALCDLVIDGAGLPLQNTTKGLIHIAGAERFDLRNCDVLNASENALYLENIGGEISGNRISMAGLAALQALESRGLAVHNNTISDCGNGGILIHRWTKGADGTLVTQNQISRISARSGGTGENGNGINVFRADAVQVTDNHVSDCAFSAIRSNAGSDVQILGNQCLRSGETAIYSEFGFESAIVANNIIDGAANGISIVNFNEGGRLASVTGNIVRNLKANGPYMHDGIGFGIGISAEADTVISANIVENAAKWGMGLGWGPYLRNVTVTGNLVREAPVGIAISTVDGAGAALIAANQFQETQIAAIAGFHWNDKATGELVTGTGSGPALLMIVNNQSAPRT